MSTCSAKFGFVSSLKLFNAWTKETDLTQRYMIKPLVISKESLWFLLHPLHRSKRTENWHSDRNRALSEKILCECISQVPICSPLYQETYSETTSFYQTTTVPRSNSKTFPINLRCSAPIVPHGSWPVLMLMGLMHASIIISKSIFTVLFMHEVRSSASIHHKFGE